MAKDAPCKNQKLLIRSLTVFTGILIWFGSVQPASALGLGWNNSSGSAEACSWKQFTNSGNQTSGGCNANEVIGTTCSGTKPAGNSSNNVLTDYICCCQVEPYVAPAPKFVMPEWQIPIDTITLSKPNCVNSDQTYSGNCKIPWIAEYISGIYNYGLSVAGILAAIMLMAGGALWLISGGDASKVTQAKELIAGSITGLVILASSYIILVQINPNLVQLNPIGIGTIKYQELQAAKTRNDSTAKVYTDSSCATDDELRNGVDFYATGYYKPAWEDSDKFRCVVAMQCTCPLGQDNTKNCDYLYGNTFPDYKPCKPFPENEPYCPARGGPTVIPGKTIAGPKNCTQNLPKGTPVCFKGKNYTITDTGGGIKGKRIDIWAGTSLPDALAYTGVGKLTKGECP